MKNKFLNIFGGILLFAGISTNAQILTNSNVVTALTGSNYFLDASNFEGLANQNYGRGLGFPRTNLTTFQFDTAPMDNDVTLSNFDGMVVYNTTAGNTLTGQGVITAVTPGFYYFSNPGNPGNITNGKWVPIAGANAGVKENILTTETVTNRLINNAQIYAIKSSFTVNGSTAPNTYTNPVIIPSTGSLYRITIYQAGTNNVYANSVYSYDKTNGNFITGSPSMSVVYPNGNYDYVVEYTK
ncbi:hypothetical protein CQ046_03940 [Chryseobacterium sp. MYb7]|uniref:hypothetical protein n=1 Tax=Chryseobacterium sp. MYb7 TaxID=1827290 RepID=UPI000D0009F5|nr:hypothetical protein [Chryseobacterium sp. MYb7]PRB05728.1 hypothetical protein CQ046_03940 [Chryseobacterium sp. MYb7]